MSEESRGTKHARRHRTTVNDLRVSMPLACVALLFIALNGQHNVTHGDGIELLCEVLCHSPA